jgi:hypothetical protein
MTLNSGGTEVKLLIDQKLSRARHIVSKWIPYETRKRTSLPKPVVSLNRSATASKTNNGSGKRPLLDNVLVGHKMRKALLSQAPQNKKDSEITRKHKSSLTSDDEEDEGLCKWKINPNKG